MIKRKFGEIKTKKKVWSLICFTKHKR
jgi:hypothetical protein